MLPCQAFAAVEELTRERVEANRAKEKMRFGEAGSSDSFEDELELTSSPVKTRVKSKRNSWVRRIVKEFLALEIFRACWHVTLRLA